jgi:4-azaleucine resistance transporter AzlC
MLTKARTLSPPTTAFWQGIKAEIPITIGVIPFGLIYGVLGLSAGLTPLQAQAMSSIVFAGSAQFLGAQLIGVGTPLPVLWLTTFIVNLRHVLYSTALGPDVQHLSRRWRWLLAYLLTDEAYAATAVHYGNHQIPLAHKHYFWLGAGLALWSVWQASTAVGVLLGTQVPPEWGLDFTLALTFIGIVVPSLKDRPNAMAALTAGLVAVLAFTCRTNSASCWPRSPASPSASGWKTGKGKWDADER